MPEFDDLIGTRHLFYGAHSEMFKLDNMVFEVEEDPDDGYRSYLRTVTLLKSTGLEGFFPTPIAVVEVRDNYTNNMGNYRCYELYDVVDGHLWLDFGTDYTVDSYYPMFQFNYHPKETQIMAEPAKSDTQIIASHISAIFTDPTLAHLTSAEIMDIINRVTALVAQRIEIDKQLGL